MEKLTGPKHNHLFTDLLKVAIFGLMLLLPFLCFLPTGFYYGFNHQAQAQEKTEQEPIYYETNEVNTIDDLVYGNIYTLNNFSSNLDNDFRINIGFYEIINAPSITYQTTTDADCIWASANSYLRLVDNNNEDNTMVFTSNGITIDFVLTNIIKSNNLLNYVIECPRQYVREYQPTTYTMSISESMYNAWESVWTSPLFNWTNTTPLNTGLNGFVSIFGINQSSYIANCLIYLLSITAIYVVFDIVLGIFKWLTHLINK